MEKSLGQRCKETEMKRKPTIRELEKRVLRAVDELAIADKRDDIPTFGRAHIKMLNAQAALAARRKSGR